MSTGWIVLPEGLGWLKPQLDGLADLYREQRGAQDVIPAFEQTLADGLNETDYERIQSFFDGEHDAVYGPDAGEHARAALREALEAVYNPAGAGEPVNSGATDPGTIHEVATANSFYEEDPRRRASREVAFGDFWSLGKSPSTWMVSWIEDTGELIGYGPNLDGTDGDWFVTADMSDAVAVLDGATRRVPYSVEVLCVEPDRTRLEALVAGWQDQRGRPDSYRWLKERVSAE